MRSKEYLTCLALLHFQLKLLLSLGVSMKSLNKHNQSRFITKVLITPKEVIDKTSNVTKRIIGRFHPIKKAIPKAVSIKGYKFA